MKKLVGIVLILAGLVIGFFVIPSLTSDSPEEILNKLKSGNEKVVTEKISTIAEESVLEYDYTNAVVLKDSDKAFKNIKIPFTSKNIVMTYDGTMKIGADVSELNAEVTKDSEGVVQKVTIDLPEVTITSNDVDRETIDFPVEKGTILNKLNSSDYDDLETKAKKEIEKSVSESSIMKDAENELKESISGFLQGLYGEDVKVSFK